MSLRGKDARALVRPRDDSHASMVPRPALWTKRCGFGALAMSPRGSSSGQTRTNFRPERTSRRDCPRKGAVPEAAPGRNLPDGDSPYERRCGHANESASAPAKEAVDSRAGLSSKGACPSSGTGAQPVLGIVPDGDSPYQTALRSCERVGLGAGEEAVDLVVQRAVVPHQLVGQRARLLE